MYSPLMNQINSIENLSTEEKRNLKELVGFDYNTIEYFLELTKDTIMTTAVRTALEDRMELLTSIYLKLGGQIEK